MYLHRTYCVKIPIHRTNKCICRVVSNRDNLSVFQNTSLKDVTMYEIESSLDVVKGLKNDDKKAYFESQLINYDNVVKYYSTVKKLNNIYNNAKNINIHVYIFSILYRLIIWLFK